MQDFIKQCRGGEGFIFIGTFSLVKLLTTIEDDQLQEKHKNNANDTLEVGKCTNITNIYFLSLLERNVKKGKIVLLFDESLNKELQKKQLDFHVRFWNYSLVQIRYYGSSFIGYATVNDLLKEGESLRSVLNIGSVIQLGMDGPNVNWSLYSKLESMLNEKFNVLLLGLGSCGLHVLHKL